MGVKQLKLSNGDELFCDIQDEVDGCLVATGVLVLRDTGMVYQEDELEARILSLFPWMTYQSELGQPMLIEKSHVIGTIIPSIRAIEYYNQSLELLSSLVDGRPGKDSDQGISNIVKFPGSKTPSVH